MWGSEKFIHRKEINEEYDFITDICHHYPVSATPHHTFYSEKITAIMNENRELSVAGDLLSVRTERTERKNIGQFITINRKAGQGKKETN